MRTGRIAYHCTETHALPGPSPATPILVSLATLRSLKDISSSKLIEFHPTYLLAIASMGTLSPLGLYSLSLHPINMQSQPASLGFGRVPAKILRWRLCGRKAA